MGKREHRIEAFIFDLDGTVIDSEENYYEADRRLFAEYGVDFSQEMKKKYIGSGNYEMMKNIKSEYGFSESAESLLEKKNRYYLELALEKTEVFPEMARLINILKQWQFPLAIASGTSPYIIERLLDRCSLTFLFDVVVSAESVNRGKPAPDVFIETARRLGKPPRVCAVFEDSKYGVEAAHRAGMTCIAIPYIIENPLPQCMKEADLLFEEGMKGFSADAVTAWLDLS